MGSFYRNRDKKRGIQPERKKIYIFCEGKETEPKYLEGFKKEIEQTLRRSEQAVIIKGQGDHSTSLVKNIIEKELLKLDINESLDEVWILFDEDTIPKGGFDNALKMIKAYNKSNEYPFQAAYSNECFELWYLLHFDYLDSDIGRNAYFDKLPKLLKKIDPSIKLTNWRKQGKTIDGIYDILKDKQTTAIRNAKKLEKYWNEEGQMTPSKRRPSTTVYKLVESLNELKNS